MQVFGERRPILSRSAIRPLIAAVACGLLVVLLGYAVGAMNEPALFWQLDRALVGHGATLAWWFTNLGYPYVLVPACLLVIVVAVVVPRWRVRGAVAIASLLISWRVADWLQRLFARPRRLDWIIKHETSFSYPSSHAAIAAGFYGLIAYLLLAHERSRAARALGWLCAGIAAGICWSRLALGAHYATDVLGGILLGTAVAAAGTTLVRR